MLPRPLTGARCMFLEWTSPCSLRAALAGTGLLQPPAHRLPETRPLSLSCLQTGKLRFRSPRVTGQGGLSGSLGLDSCLQAQDAFPPQTPQQALQHGWGGMWASRGPSGFTSLPAPTFCFIRALGMHGDH